MDKLTWWSTRKLKVAIWLLKKVLGISRINYGNFLDYAEVFGELKAKLLCVVLEGLGAKGQGILNVENRFPYNLPISIDPYDEDLWELDNEMFDLPDIVRTEDDDKTYKVYYRSAIQFIKEDDKILDVPMVDGVYHIQEIKSKHLESFMPQTFTIHVKWNEEDKAYHIKNKRELTPARKIYNVPDVKSRKK